MTKRSFIHINDVCDATIKIAENSKAGEIWHISSNEQLKICDLVRKITENTFYEEFDVNKTAKEICKWKNEMLIDFDYDYKTYSKYRLKRQGNISN